MSIIITKEYKSIVGELIIGSFNDKLCLCDWKYRDKRNQIDKRIQEGLNAKYIVGNSPIIESTINQLYEYFRKLRNMFDIELEMVGTDFQKRIWKELLSIKYGEKATYKYLADRIGDPKSIRAVAAANGANAISIIIPCHRIIGSSGELIGYAGGLKAKQGLLSLENENNQLDMNF